jgi:hypothetical protein
MPFSTTRRAPAARTLAGTVLTAALLVPAATACSSTTASHGAAASTATAAVAPTTSATPAATTPTTAPAGSPTTRATTPPAAPPGGNRTSAPSGTGKTASPAHGQTLPDGSQAEVQQLGALHYIAKIVHDGQVYATVEANGHDTGLDANDMFVVLSMDGTVHAWMGGAQQGPGTFKLAGGWTAKVTKVGELHYHADIIDNEGAVDGTLEANQHDDGLAANGVYIVLGPGGEISAHE